MPEDVKQITIDLPNPSVVQAIALLDDLRPPEFGGAILDMIYRGQVIVIYQGIGPGPNVLERVERAIRREFPSDSDSYSSVTYG